MDFTWILNGFYIIDAYWIIDFNGFEWMPSGFNECRCLW
jgi:hypothetical protein